MPIFAFKLALSAYLLSTAGYAASIFTKKVFFAKTSTWMLLFAFIFHTAYIAIRWLQTGCSPILNYRESLSFVAWAITGSYLLFQTKTKTRVLGTIVVPFVLFLVIQLPATSNLTDWTSTPAILQGWWITTHTILSLAGEALFTLAACAGIMYLIQDNLIKQSKAYRIRKLLPPLQDLDRINHISILLGFIFLTLGIITGTIRAQAVWGSHWQWDPKQIWIMITWFLYAILLHQRLAIGWKGKKAAIFSIIAFATLIFAVIGVRFFFVTVHIFA